VPLCGSYNPAPETWDGLGYSAFARPEPESVCVLVEASGKARDTG